VLKLIERKKSNQCLFRNKIIDQNIISNLLSNIFYDNTYMVHLEYVLKVNPIFKYKTLHF